MDKNKAFTLIELMICIAIIAIIVTLACGLGRGCSVSDGSRTGTISKFSHKGVFNKSWEGEMILGGMVAGQHGAVANVWHFSVLNQDVAKQLEGCTESNLTVNLSYHQTFGRNPFNRDTTYDVYKVKVVNGQ